MKTVWNDDEDEALQGLPLRAQIIYLRGIRRYMDYSSGITGGYQRRISLTMLAETSQEMVNRQILPKPSKDSVRAAIEQLKRAGLIERLDNPEFLLFFLPKADTLKSAQNNHTIIAPQLGHSYNTNVQASASNGKTSKQTITSHPKSKLNQPTHQTTDYQEITLKGGEGNSPPYQSIVELYHTSLPTLPRVYKLTEQRRLHINALWQDELDDLDSWQNYFRHIARADFLMGRQTGRDGLPFLATFDFIIDPVKFIKIAEEHYHGQKIQKSRR